VSSAPSEGDVRNALERLLASPHFSATERRRAFLRYIVEEALAGKAGRLKGYAIAISVFGREDSFDAQADPVVRIEARRLRRDLDSYYIAAGRADPVRISVPKGSYVPFFEWQQTREEAEVVAPGPGEHTDAVIAQFDAHRQHADSGKNRLSTPGRRRWGALMVMATLAAVAIISKWYEPQPVWKGDGYGPAVVVRQFEGLNATDHSQHIASGLTHELITQLMRFPGFRLYVPPINEESGTAQADVAPGLGRSYVVNGSVNLVEKNLRVAARLLNAATNQVIWAKSYDRPLSPEALMHVQSELASQIAGALVQPYGAVHSDLDGRHSLSTTSSMADYFCVLRAYDYRRGFAREKFDPVLGCLQRAVRADPQYSDAWAMLAWLKVDAGRIGYVGYGTPGELYTSALQAATRANTLHPDNTLALKALAAVHHYMGRHTDSERLSRRAFALNPHDPEIMAQLGWRLAARGNFEEGTALLARAISRTVHPPGWYHHFIAIDHHRKGEYRQMLSSAERSARDGRGVSQFLIAIAAGELGDRQSAKQALQKLSAHEKFARDPAAYMRRHGIIDETVAALMAGLQRARRLALQP